MELSHDHACNNAENVSKAGDDLAEGLAESLGSLWGDMDFRRPDELKSITKVTLCRSPREI